MSIEQQVANETTKVLTDAHRISIAVRNADFDTLNEMIFKFFVGLRIGLDESDRMNYISTDPLYIMLSAYEMDIRDLLFERELS